MSNHSQIQINASLQTTLSILPSRRFTLHSSVSSSSYFLFFFFEFSLPSFPSFLSKSISLPSGSLPSLVCLVNVRVYTRVKRACACGVYTRYSHPLNSTWHKQQSLCKKKGTIFVKRNIHALYHVSSSSRSPSSPHPSLQPPVFSSARRVEKGRRRLSVAKSAREYVGCIILLSF